MVNMLRDDEILASMNRDETKDLYKSNLNLADFNEFNEILDCKYFTEESFVEKYSKTNDLLFMNANIQSLALS